MHFLFVMEFFNNKKMLHHKKIFPSLFFFCGIIFKGIIKYGLLLHFGLCMVEGFFMIPMNTQELFGQITCFLFFSHRTDLLFPIFFFS